MNASSPSFTLRNAIPADLRDEVALFLAVFRAPPYAEDWDRTAARRYLADLARGRPAIGFVARDESGRLLGFLLGALHGTVRGFVYELAVAADARRQGVGTALLDRFTKTAAARGARSLELLARRDMPAYRFYRKRGFRMPRRVVVLIRAPAGN